MEVHLERHVAHSPERMFDLVADLQSYPRFIPNCRAMEIRGDDARGLLAKMTLRFGPITQGYTSQVELDRRSGVIRARAIDGPFAYLETQWAFSPEATGACVRFNARFRISNPLVAAIAEPAFAAKQEEIMNAFVAEADHRYAAQARSVSVG